MRRLLPTLAGIALGLAAGHEGAPRTEGAPIAEVAVPVLAPGAPPLPQVLPFPHDPLRPPAGTTHQASGTGFFATPAGVVVTAAHVVDGCRTIRLASAHLPATEARVIASDAETDVALLQADAPAPAHLALAAAARPESRVLVYGFPATARRDVPDTTWASVVNGHVATAVALERDPGRLVWMQAAEIAQGYSGGPVLDPADGRVVGIVRALIDPGKAAAAYGISMPDLSIGPGTTPLRAALSRAGLEGGAHQGEEADMFARARMATVHVYCWL